MTRSTAIRRLTSDDASALLELRRAAHADAQALPGFPQDIEESTTLNLVESELRPDSQGVTIGVFAADKLVGAGSIWPRDKVLPWQQVAHLLGVVVHPASRRQGVASSVVNACVEYARAQGVRWINLAVFLPNDPALKLYESLGFKYFGGESRVIAKGEERAEVREMTLPPD